MNKSSVISEEKSSFTVCCFHGCANVKSLQAHPNSKNKRVNVLFHNFPHSSSRQEKWAQACKKINLITHKSEVCSDHFEPKCYPPGSSKKVNSLLNNAIPTIRARKEGDAHSQTNIIAYRMEKDWGAWLCRLCACAITPIEADSDGSRTNGIHIFGEEGQMLHLEEKINMFLTKQVALEDSLPKFVCKQCAQKVTVAANAVLSFRAADRKLRNELNTNGHLMNLEDNRLHGDVTKMKEAFQCLHCDHEFSDEKTLLQHELSHFTSQYAVADSWEVTDTVSLFTCNHCPATFLSKSSQMLHAKQCHSESLKEECVKELIEQHTEVIESPTTVPHISNLELTRLDAMHVRGSQLQLNNIQQSAVSELNVDDYLTKHGNTTEITDAKILYECSKCASTFRDVEIFKLHLNFHSLTPVRDEKICTHCNKTFTSKGLKMHQIHLSSKAAQLGDNQFVCDYCAKTFSSRTSIEGHMRKNHSSIQFACPKCPRTFKSKEGLKGHLFKHEGWYQYLCDICGKSFLTQSSMMNHRKHHDEQNFFTCNQCGKKIQEHNRFQDHLRTHTGETPFCCDICSRRFHSKKLLKQHMQIHSDSRPHKCEQCNMSFKRIGNLRQHIERHETYRPICSICRSSFNTCEERNEHRRTHTKAEREAAKLRRMKAPGPPRNRNQYPCKACKTVFTTKEEKAEHLAANPDHSRSIKCDECDLAFRSIQSLTVHQRIHTGVRPYVCNVCNRNFRTYATFRQHAAVHECGSKFKCDVCEKSFNRQYSLTVHKRSHTSERPFICAICSRSFKQKQDLTKHARLHEIKSKDDMNEVSNIQISEVKWGNMVLDESMILDQQLSHNNISSCETITIPADIGSYSSGLLTGNNIVITVPYVNTDTGTQSFFTM